MNFQQTHFIKSAARLSDCPPDTGAEIAFCGRSNAGKSSAINEITSQRKLARTSKTPGRTQLINFFALAADARLVDLPGYGFARVPDKVKDDWHRNLDSYLRGRDSLVGLVLLVDIRHPLKAFDEMMIRWCTDRQMPLHILLTKADKLSNGARQSVLLKLRRQLPAGVTSQLFSALIHIGIEEAREVLTARLLARLPALDQGFQDQMESEEPVGQHEAGPVKHGP